METNRGTVRRFVPNAEHDGTSPLALFRRAELTVSLAFW